MVKTPLPMQGLQALVRVLRSHMLHIGAKTNTHTHTKKKPHKGPKVTHNARKKSVNILKYFFVTLM